MRVSNCCRKTVQVTVEEKLMTVDKSRWKLMSMGESYCELTEVGGSCRELSKVGNNFTKIYELESQKNLARHEVGGRVKGGFKALAWSSWLIFCFETNINSAFKVPVLLDLVNVYDLYFRNGVLNAKYLPVKLQFDKETKRIYPVPTKNAKWISVCGKGDAQCQNSCKVEENENKKSYDGKISNVPYNNERRATWAE